MGLPVLFTYIKTLRLNLRAHVEEGPLFTCALKRSKFTPRLSGLLTIVKERSGKGLRQSYPEVLQSNQMVVQGSMNLPAKPTGQVKGKKHKIQKKNTLM